MAQPLQPGPHESVKAIAARLMLIRIAYGRAQGRTREISQSEFAKLCEIGISAWNNAETGDNRIGLDNALNITRRTGVGIEYIYRAVDLLLPRAIAVEIAKLEDEERQAVSAKSAKRA